MEQLTVKIYRYKRPVERGQEAFLCDFTGTHEQIVERCCELLRQYTEPGNFSIHRDWDGHSIGSAAVFDDIAKGDERTPYWIKAYVVDPMKPCTMTYTGPGEYIRMLTEALRIRYPDINAVVRKRKKQLQSKKP